MILQASSLGTVLQDIPLSKEGGIEHGLITLWLDLAGTRGVHATG